MQAEVDIADTSGKLLADAPRTRPVSTTDIHDQATKAADMLAQNIIARNLATPAASSSGKHASRAGSVSATGRTQ